MAFNMQAILTFTGKGIKETSGKLEGVMKKVGKLGKETSESLTSAAESLGKAAIPATAIGAGFGFAIHKAIEFDATMQALQAQTGATAEDLATMGFAARRAATNTGQSAEAAAKSILIMSKAGLTAAESTMALDTALSAADATGVGVAEATMAIATGLEAMSGSFPATMGKVERFNKLSDMMVFTVNKTGASMAGLQDAMQTGGTALSKMGVPLQQIVASFGLLEKAGMGGGAGAQSLVMMMRQLAEPSDLASKELRKLGIDVKKLDLKDVAGTVSTLSRSFSAIKDPIKRARLEAEVFGPKGVKVFNALERGGSDALAKLSANVEASQGATKKFEDIRTNTFKEQMERLATAAGQIVSEIGMIFTENKDTVLPFLKDVVTLVQDIAKAFLFAAGDTEAFGKKFEELTPGQQAMIEFAKGFREGIAQAFVVAKEVFTSIKSFLGGILGEGNMNLQMIGQWTAKILLLAAVAGPILLGIAGAVGAIGWVVGGVSTLIGALASTIGFLGTVASTVFSVISFAITAVSTTLSVLWTIGSFVFSALAGAVSFLLSPIGLVIGAIALIGAGIVGVFKRWDEVKAAFQEGFIPGMLSLFKAFGQGILDLIMWPIEKVKSAVSKVAAFFGFGDDGEATVKVKQEGVERVPASKQATATETIRQITAEDKQQTATLGDIANQQDMASQVQQDAVMNKRLTSPLSAAEPTAQAMSASMPTPQINMPAGGGEKTINTNVSVQIDGKEIAKAVARNQIENSERSGRTMDPGAKRRMLESGALATGGN